MKRSTYALLGLMATLFATTTYAQTIGEKTYSPPHEIQCTLTQNDVLKCDGVNHNYLYEGFVITPDLIERDKVATYIYDSVETGSKTSLQALFTYKNPNTQARITLQTSYVLIAADIKHGKWVLEPEGFWYECPGKGPDCPLTNLPF